jgi:stage V sporulation protein SpoVS
LQPATTGVIMSRCTPAFMNIDIEGEGRTVGLF